MSNLEFYDVEEAVSMDVKLFKEAGGGTIVENSSHGLKRDISLMRNISKSMEVNVIAGTGTYFRIVIITRILLPLFLMLYTQYFHISTGYYVASVQTESTLNTTKEKMYNLMYRELKESCIDCPKELQVKAGFIGEVGSTWPIEGRH